MKMTPENRKQSERFSFEKIPNRHGAIIYRLHTIYYAHLLQKVCLLQESERKEVKEQY